MTVDFPQRWRLSATLSGRGLDVEVRQRPAPKPVELAPAPAPPPPAPEPEPERIEGGSVHNFEHAGFGFHGPRWTPLEDGNADP